MHTEAGLCDQLIGNWGEAANVTGTLTHGPKYSRPIPQLPAGRAWTEWGLCQAVVRHPFCAGQGGPRGFWVRHQVKRFLPYPTGDKKNH